MFVPTAGTQGSVPSVPSASTRSTGHCHGAVTQRLPARLTYGEAPKKETARGYMTQPDPQEIARRAAQRDTEAFAALYDEHLNTVYRFVFFKVSDSALAEDLTAEVFSKAWENIDRFEWRDLPFQHWLLRVARNVVVDHWRAHRRFPASLDGLYELPSDELSPEDIVARDGEVQRVSQALAKLADDQREVLILRFIEGYSHADAAQVLKKSVVAVRQIQVRALRALRDVMRDGETPVVARDRGGLAAVARRGPEPRKEPAG